MWRSKNGTLGKTTATLYIMYKVVFLISEVVTPAIQCDIQQNTLHVRQHHIFHVKCGVLMTFSTPRLISLFDYHMIHAIITSMLRF